MSSYVKATNFYTKDALLTGNPSKIIKGSEIDSEYNAIATAVNSKADITSPAFTGSPTVPTAVSGTNTTQIASTAFVTAAMALVIIYPVGSIYTSTVATNPVTLLGFGTWVAFGEGKVLIGNGGGFSAGATGGSADAIIVSHTHTATVTDPVHTHTWGANEFAQGTVISSGHASSDGLNYLGKVSATSASATGVTVSNSTTGSSGTNANLQPYIVVYMWNRTA